MAERPDNSGGGEPRDGDAEKYIIDRAEVVVASFEEHWSVLQAHRRNWLRTMIAGALVEQDSDSRDAALRGAQDDIGTTRIHKMFDRAIEEAINQGAEGIDEHEDQEA